MTSVMFDDGGFRDACMDWEKASIVPDPASDGLLERLRQVLSFIKSQPWNTSQVDLIGLVRQWQLRRFSRGENSWLRVPKANGWPDASSWREAGFEVAELDSTLEVQAKPVRIPWLGTQSDFFDDVFAESVSRTHLDVPADPLLTRLLHVPTCLSEGQRECLRALVHLPEDVTLIANLPTGSGKSSLAHLAPLLHGEGFLVLTIVPTVALAIDQARRMAELFLRKDPHWQPVLLAFHGGLTQEERSAVFQAIRNGQQRMLFTSPESATGTLRDALETAASLGRLTHIIVDEAHLVATWGSGFRPAFQLLPGLIRHLRDVSSKKTQRPIRVVLASATLTKGTINVLQHHFGPAAKTELVSGVHLRAEPRYAFRHCDSLFEQRKLAAEVLRVAPRPFILYVTRPDEAETLYQALRQEGFRRIDYFTGLTQSSDRERLLRKWNDGLLDGMVATSAFGLGIDKADVRTVIHATLPESLDRFYQEVGRSGRDGRASASLLLYTDQDIDQARGMSAQKQISNEFGFKRWQSMITMPVSQPNGSDQVWVDLDALPNHLHQHSPANRAWNLRTLNLMALAGLLEICALRTHPPENGQTEEEIVADSDAFYAAIRILENQHQKEAVFNERMNVARNATSKSSDVGVRAMLDVATGAIEISEALHSIYELKQDNAFAPVARCCGGCPKHWLERRHSIKYPRPFVSRISRFAERTEWKKSTKTFPMALPNLLIVTYPKNIDDTGLTGSLVKALVSRLRPHTVVMDKLSSTQEWGKVRNSVTSMKSDAFIDTYDRERPASFEGSASEVRVLLWAQDFVSKDDRSTLWSSPCDLTVWVIPQETMDPDRPDRRWADVIEHIRSDTLMQELSA